MATFSLFFGTDNLFVLIESVGTSPKACQNEDKNQNPINKATLSVTNYSMAIT